ncbi:50S ribosomal protein L9 [Angustibacter aerolatus]|uniref:Large ribosomal subunit protein bL9 n=1 Tax=Angustibacter aerolatus TaxID=1162965 RepID=A0ABQ6JFY6_9ACTN|nr:50S ribosomal protein L9 [Angustibacter aerolatus]GMA87105.1 50S ribosomal protein L9 [Angustibacter aerolatus]
MKLILTQEVTGLGAPGDVVVVKDGYGRNFLLPRSLATPWTKGGQKQVDAIRKARSTREVASVEQAQTLKARLEQGAVTLTAHAGAGGRLFGAITTADVAEAVSSSGGPELDRRKIELGQPIKAVGRHDVSVRLHPEVSAKLTLEVVAG